MMDKQQCAGCGRSIGTGTAPGLCVHCSVNKQTRSEADHLAMCLSRIATLEAGNKALREALEPFAKEATRWERGLFTDSDHTSIRAGGVKEPSEVTIGDLRRAAALLEPK